MKTIQQTYEEGFIDGTESGKSFKEWISHLPGFYIERCQIGIRFTLTKEILVDTIPDDRGICSICLDDIHNTSKQEIGAFGVKTLADIRAALADSPTSNNRSVYEKSSVSLRD